MPKVALSSSIITLKPLRGRIRVFQKHLLLALLPVPLPFLYVATCHPSSVSYRFLILSLALRGLFHCLRTFIETTNSNNFSAQMAAQVPSRVDTVGAVSPGLSSSMAQAQSPAGMHSHMIPMAYGSPPQSGYPMMLAQSTVAQSTRATSPTRTNAPATATTRQDAPRVPVGPIAERPAEWSLQPPPEECHQCHLAFGLFRRQHPCACCNFAFCSNCCAFKADVPFASGTLQNQRVCEECHDHIQRSSKTCLKRLTPYLEASSPQLLETLTALPDLIVAEPVNTSITILTTVLFGLLPKLDIHSRSAQIAASFRLVSVLAVVGAISPGNPPLDPVLELLSSSLSSATAPSSLKIAASQCISALALDPRFVSILSKSRLISNLIPCMSSSDDEVLQAASGALAPLVKDGATLSTEDTERLSSSLIPISQGVLATDPARAARSKETLQSILNILSSLSSERSHQEAIYVSGGVQVLLQIAQIDHSVPTLSPIFEILSNVSKIPETLVAILHHQGLSVLLELLGSIMPELQKQSTMMTKPRTDSDRQRKRLCKQLLSLLLKLCHRSDDNFEDRERIISVVIKPSTLETLSSLLPSEHIGKVQRVVVELLLLSIISDETRTAAGKANVLINLTQLIVLSLTHSNASGKKAERTTQRLPRLVELLCALIKGHEGNTAALVECGVLALLLDVLSPQSTSQLTVHTARLLASVSAFPTSHGYITSSISSVVQLVTSQAPEIVESGLTILANLSAVPDSRGVVFSDTTVATVMPLMSSANSGVQLQAAKFLSGISQDPRASSEMFSSVLAPLLVQLSSQVTPVRHTAIITLLDLLRSSQPKGGVDSSAGMKTMLAKADGAVSSIASIMASCKPPTPTHPEAVLRQSCAELLSLLAGNPTGRAVISSTPHAIQVILQSLFSPDEILVHWSVISLAALLRNSDSQLAEALRTSGGLKVLSRLLDLPSTSQALHHAVISAISQLFGYPNCRQFFLDEGIIRRLLQTVLDATKSAQDGHQLDPSVRSRVFAAIAALQQLVQSANEVAQAIAKDAPALKNLADSIITLSPRLGSGSPNTDSEMCEQLLYLVLLLCSVHSDAWATLVRAGGLNFLLALAASNNLSAKRSALNELSRLSLDISFRKIIFDGDGLTTALQIVENTKDLPTILAAESSSPSALGLHVLEKALEVVTNVCEDGPALASLLQLNGAARLVVFLSKFVESSPDILQSKMVISVAYNLVRILLQMLMSQKSPTAASMVPALPSLLRLVSIDISQASYQSLQLTKIVCDTIVKLMIDPACTSTLRSLNAPQIFINLLVRYRPSLQSPNIAEIAISALTIFGETDTGLSGLGLVIPSEDLESLFAYLKHPIILRIIFSLASDKRSSFRSSLDKAAIEKLLPHVHSLLTSGAVDTPSSDPIALVTAIFQPKAGQPPSFALLDDGRLIHLVHSLVGYLDPRKPQPTSDVHDGGKKLLAGLSLLRYMAHRPCVHRPAASHVSADPSGLEASLTQLRVSSLLKADSETFTNAEPPRLALLQLLLTLVKVYFPDVHLNLTDVSPTSTTNSNDLLSNGDVSEVQEPVAHAYDYAPIELLQLTELILALLASLSKSSSLHSILSQSGIVELLHQSLRHFLEIEGDASSSSSDLSLAAKQEVIGRQVPQALEILENMSIGESPIAVPFTSTLFEILAIGVSRPLMVSILDLLRTITTKESSISQIIAVDGMMSLIGLLSNDNNQVTSLSLSILCNLAKFDSIQATLSQYIDSTLLSELSDRLGDTELAYNLAKLKSYLGIFD